MEFEKMIDDCEGVEQSDSDASKWIMRFEIDKETILDKNITMDDMRKIKEVDDYILENNLDREVLEQTEIQIKYAGYIDKEKANADKLNRLEGIRIPENFDYSKLKSLSYEALEKLRTVKPVTVSQASRISGVSPNDISVLLVYMGR